jgi:hypothetical protein
MTKSYEMEIPYGGRIVRLSRILLEKMAGEMGNHLIRAREILRRILSSDTEIESNHPDNPQKFEKIRDRVFLDINRNIR